MTSPMKRALLPLVVLVVLLGAGLLVRADVRSSLHKHHARDVREGYHATLGYFREAPRRQPERLHFLISPPGAMVRVDVIHRSLLGPGAIEIGPTEPNAAPVFSARGWRFEKRQELELSPGEYEVTIDLRRSWVGGLDLGMDGAVTWVHDLDPRLYTKVDSSAADGFHWPYFLYMPRKLAASPPLLVVPNNTGRCADDLRIHEESAKGEILRAARVADEIGVPVLVPVFPRSEADSNVYTHALDRDVLDCGRKDIGRLDLQLAAMAEHAGKLLAGRGVQVNGKLLLFGFSASGMFVNRFTILHPDLVTAVACGSPGGWPIAPVVEYKGKSLRYPIGIADVPALVARPVDLAGMRRVPMFFFLGGEDRNDSVVFRDGYEEQDEKLVFGLFGETLQDRWKVAESLYRDAGLNARFVLYPGVGHEITPEMAADITRFLGEHVRSTGS